MKGIAHFMSGAAVSTFFPWTMAAALDGNPIYFILGGAFGILPDTLDFKIYRFFYKHDVYIEPDPHNFDSQEIADTIAASIGQAMTSDKMIRVKLSSIRLGADYWQQYTAKFNVEKGEVSVKFGSVVNTGQVPVPGTEPEKEKEAIAKLPCPLDITYDASATVDIFDGPTFGFEKSNDGVTLHFLPWHREWTHALTVGLFFAVIIWPLLWPWLGWEGWKASLVVLGAYSVHVIEDQMGFMGSNLFFPISKKRTQGLHIMRSGDALPNFSAVWISCLLMFWNMYRFSPPPEHPLGFFQLFFWAAILPVGLFWFAIKWLTRNEGADDEANIMDADEWEETASV